MGTDRHLPAADKPGGQLKSVPDALAIQASSGCWQKPGEG